MAKRKVSGKKKLKLKKKAGVKKTTAVKRKVVKRKKKVLAIPKGYHSVTPYMIFDQAANAIEFYKKAFGAKATMCMEHGGKVGHAELVIGDAKIMLSDECPEMGAHSPKAYGGSSIMIHLYVKNADAVVAKAASLGAKITRPMENMFYGDRSGMIQDPFGYSWCISTHIEDLTKAQMKKRSAELFGKK